MCLKEAIEEFARQSIALYVSRCHSSEPMRKAAETLELAIHEQTGQSVTVNRYIHEE